jgi:hypothetical protein
MEETRKLHKIITWDLHSTVDCVTITRRPGNNENNNLINIKISNQRKKKRKKKRNLTQMKLRGMEREERGIVERRGGESPVSILQTMP